MNISSAEYTQMRDKERIKKENGRKNKFEKFKCEIGNLYVGENSEDTKIPNENIGKDAIFDTANLNYHFYTTNRETLSGWEDAIKKKREAIINCIEIGCVSDHNVSIETIRTKKEFKAKREEGVKDRIYLWAGSNGQLKQNGKKICELFKHIEAVKNGVLYNLNFMRFYIEDGKVNCIVKAIQFDRVIKGTVTNNGEISYPETDKPHKNLEDLINANPGQNFFYNPDVTFDEKQSDKILTAFIDFIDTCERVEKHTK